METTVREMRSACRIKDTIQAEVEKHLAHFPAMTPTLRDLSAIAVLSCARTQSCGPEDRRILDMAVGMIGAGLARRIVGQIPVDPSERDDDSQSAAQAARKAENHA